MRKSLHIWGMLAVVLLLSSLLGCASIVSKSNWPVYITTNPTGANCSISKNNNYAGPLIYTGATPIYLNLDSSRGFFLPANYTVTCLKEGYKTCTSEFSGNLNKWYIGNILFGGLPGFLIVDPATGAMWKLDETLVINMVKNMGT